GGRRSPVHLVSDAQFHLPLADVRLTALALSARGARRLPYGVLSGDRLRCRDAVRLELWPRHQAVRAGISQLPRGALSPDQVSRDTGALLPAHVWNQSVVQLRAVGRRAAAPASALSAAVTPFAGPVAPHHPP